MMNFNQNMKKNNVQNTNQHVLENNIWIKACQLNLHHSKAAVITMNEWLKKNSKKHQVIAFIQEPYLANGRKISGFSRNFSLFQGKENCKVRSCIVVSKALNAWLLTQFSDEDTTTIGVKLNSKIFIFCSGYFDYYSAKKPPPKIIDDLTKECISKGWNLIIAADANAHHTEWGSTDINDRGDPLLDFIYSRNLHICNIGSEPTFQDCRRKQVIDITLCNDKMLKLISQWKVSKDLTMSDHNRIDFNILGNNFKYAKKTFIDLAQTDWKGLREDLINEVNKITFDLDLDNHERMLSEALSDSFFRNCKEIIVRERENPVFWNSSLTEKRAKARTINKRFKKHEEPEDELLLKDARADYRYALRKAGPDKWKKDCTELDSLHHTARLHKALTSERKRELGTMKDKNDIFTDTPEDTHNLLLEEHFPSRDLETEVEAMDYGEIDLENTELSDKMIHKQALYAAFNSFPGKKAPGPDGIYPMIIQKCLDIIDDHLISIYKKCINQEKSPANWLKSRAVFLTKPDKKDYSKSNSLRPLCLSSFLLKGLERLVLAMNY